MDDDNVYYSPEKFGLTVVDEYDHGESYEFDIRVIWKHEDGTYYTAADSGCSCPTPFEGFTSLASLTIIEPHVISELRGEDDSPSWQQTLDVIAETLK